MVSELELHFGHSGYNRQLAPLNRFVYPTFRSEAELVAIWILHGVQSNPKFANNKNDEDITIHRSMNRTRSAPKVYGFEAHSQSRT